MRKRRELRGVTGTPASGIRSVPAFAEKGRGGRRTQTRRWPLWRAGLLAGCAALVASSAIAQVAGPSAPLRLRTDYFGYGASVSPRVSYTDNIQLAPEGLEEDSFIGSTLFSGAAIWSSSRFTGILNGDLDFSYIDEGSDFVVNQDIAATTTTTVVDNMLYVDVSGQTSRQLLGENARFSSNVNAARRQRANVHSFAASPYLYHQFPNASTAELRYRYSQVYIDDDNAGANPFAGGLLNDSSAHEIVASYESGRLFDRLRFTATAYANRTVEDGAAFAPDFEYEQGSASLAAQYFLNERFALSGAVGYDEIDTETVPGLFDDDDLSGVFWRAGFFAQPGRKLTARIEYGRRYDDDFVDAAVTYQLSRRFQFTAGANRSFQTRAQAVSGEQRALQRQTLEFADRLREGQTLSPEGIIQAANRFARGGVNAQTFGFSTTDSAYARLAGAYDRLQLSLAGNYQDSDFGFRQNTVYGATFDIRRQLSRRLTAYARAFYRHADTDFDPAVCQANPFLFGFDVDDPLFDPVAACEAFALNNGRTKTAGGDVGISWRIYRNVSAFAEYGRTNRFADSALLEYAENTATAGLTIDF